MRAAANDGVLNVAALLHNDIIHHNGAHDLHIVAQLAGAANDGALHAALVAQHAALADNAACRHCGFAAQLHRLMHEVLKAAVGLV